MRLRNVTDEQLIEAVKTSHVWTDVCRKVGVSLSGSQYYRFRDRCLSMNLDVSHFHGWNKGLVTKLNEFLFVENCISSTGVVKKRILRDKLLEYKCEICNICDWQNNSLMLELDHKNGIGNDHRLENLRFLCPNCHSQTLNFKGKNINKNKEKTEKVTDERLMNALYDTQSIGAALRSVGLTPKGANYTRMCRLIALCDDAQLKQLLGSNHKKRDKLIIKKNLPEIPKVVIKEKKVFPHKTKIEWPSNEELQKLLWEFPTTELAKRFGVSDNAINHRCEKFNISKPPRGYWAKVQAGKL